MNSQRLSIWLGVLFVILSTFVSWSAGTTQLNRAIAAITKSLPSGWTIAEQKSGEIPWGHHWNENYTGPTGVLLVAKGVRPVNADFLSTNGTWHAVHVATESLKIWLMPSNYSDSILSRFAIGRPISPTVVIGHGPVKVYAEPSSTIDSEKHFDEILNRNVGIKWPDSPANNPKLLTWKDWRLKMKEAIEKEF